MSPAFVRVPLRIVRRVVFYIALVPGILALLFGIWLFWPVSKQTKPSYEKIAVPAAASPATSKQGAPFSLIATRACQGRLVQLVHRSLNAPKGECLIETLDLETTLNKALEHKQALGHSDPRANIDHCIITDATGQVTDLGNITTEASTIARLSLRNGGSIPDDDDTQARLDRVMTVGICSLQKTLKYWSEHPNELPAPDDIPSSVFFNPATGRPEKSEVLDAFLDVVSWALTKRLDSQSSAQ